MLQNVRFINYRGLKDTTLPLAPITLLTGTNGIGKTSVLEGLYFLLSQSPDAATFPRYPLHHGVQANAGASNGWGYDYASFWNECPTSGASGCRVEAALGDFTLTWEMKISDFAQLTEDLKSVATAYGLQTGVGAQYALWEWNCKGKVSQDNGRQETVDVSHGSKAFQQLSMEPRFSPRIGTGIATVCRYVDMSSTRYIPEKLPLATENFLTDGLKIIKPGITGVRRDGGNQPRLRVIVNEKSEYSLGTLGVGAETWASMFLALAELADTSTGQASVMFLADEIGAGIHYGKLEEVWDFLLKFLSHKPQIQMVLTTHSHDCINAFCKTFQNATPGMAHIVRLNKFDEEEGVLTTVLPQEMFDSILSGEWEVRG